MQSQKVLQVRIHGGLFRDILIGQGFVSQLDQQSIQRHSGINRSLALLASEVFGILHIEFPPRNQFAQLEPVIIRVAVSRTFQVIPAWIPVLYAVCTCSALLKVQGFSRNFGDSFAPVIL